MEEKEWKDARTPPVTPLPRIITINTPLGLYTSGCLHNYRTTSIFRVFVL